MGFSEPAFQFCVQFLTTRFYPKPFFSGERARTDPAVSLDSEVKKFRKKIFLPQLRSLLRPRLRTLCCSSLPLEDITINGDSGHGEEFSIQCAGVWGFYWLSGWAQPRLPPVSNFYIICPSMRQYQCSLSKTVLFWSQQEHNSKVCCCLSHMLSLCKEIS